MNWKVYQHIGVPYNPIFHGYPTKDQCVQISKKLKVPILRWIDDWDSKFHYPFYAVIQDGFTDISKLKSKVRYEINRALVRHLFCELSIDEFIKEGYSVYEKSFKLYDTYLKLKSSCEWEKEYFTSNNLDEQVLIFGIREKSTNLLVAYAYGIIYSNGNFFDLKVVKFDPDYQKNNISELLFYEIGKELISRRNVSFIFDGYQSIAHKSGIQEYLIRKFEYRKVSCRLNIYYTSIFSILIFSLYPFNSVISHLKNISSLFYKIHVLLIQEKLRRDCKKLS